MKCPHCNQEHFEGTKYCPETGKKMPAPIIGCPNKDCPNFGRSDIPSHYKFCPECGAKLEKETEVLPEQDSDFKKTFSIGGVSFSMIKVEGGTFKMGSTIGENRERPVHDVTLSPFWIGETQVTQKLWSAVMGDNPSDFTGDDNPVNRVSWVECERFVMKLNELTQQQFYLPTEAEWEFAARGGNISKGFLYAGSDNIEDVAWFDENSQNEVQPVARKEPNELGLFDMSGNVWEWCQDWGDRGYYKKSPNRDPKGPSAGTDRVLRGGGRNSIAGNCRVAYRNFNNPENKRSSIGLRIAMVHF